MDSRFCRWWRSYAPGDAATSNGPAVDALSRPDLRLHRDGLLHLWQAHSRAAAPDRRPGTGDLSLFLRERRTGSADRRTSGRDSARAAQRAFLTPEKQLARFMAKSSPEIRNVATAALRKLRDRLPGA